MGGTNSKKEVAYKRIFNQVISNQNKEIIINYPKKQYYNGRDPKKHSTVNLREKVYVEKFSLDNDEVGRIVIQNRSCSD